MKKLIYKINYKNGEFEYFTCYSRFDKSVVSGNERLKKLGVFKSIEFVMTEAQLHAQQNKIFN